MTPPPTTTWSTCSLICSSSAWVGRLGDPRPPSRPCEATPPAAPSVGSVRLGQARRVRLGLLDGLVLQAPALQHLRVGAVLERVVERRGDRRSQAVALE